MERAKKIIEALKSGSTPPTEQEVLNILREYLQTIVLKLIYQSKFGGALSFMGGTALRICYNLKRYSEDLDFTYDSPDQPYRFSSLMQEIVKELELRGFQVTSTIHEDKIVQKGFLRFGGLSQAFGLKQIAKDQKLHIKLEVDVRPIPLKKGERESFFVNRFQEIFPILKHTLPTLFAGKILALLYRPYQRGRDYYDLIWYLTQKVDLNLDYLNRGVKEKKFKNEQEVFETLEDKIKTVKPTLLLKDISRFLEDSSEETWISRYQELYAQLIKARIL